MTEKDMFLQSWENEFKTTVKVLKAYPEDKTDLKPHEISKSAKELAFNFLMEEGLIGQAIKGEISFGPAPELPKSMAELITMYEHSHNDLVQKVKDLSDESYNSTIKFMTGPQQMGDLRKADIFWMMVHDMIHHRGQFSVYLRMAGGKVPSIYGPSHDEPWM